MLKVNFYNLEVIEDSKLYFAVVSARYQGKWVFARHKQRSTWEIAGGHREIDEDISRTAARELIEETGAVDFKLYPICVYSVEKDDSESFGQLFYAEILQLGPLVDSSEIGEIKLFSNMPDKLTYPLIQPYLFEKTIEFLKSDQEEKIELSECFNYYCE